MKKLALACLAILILPLCLAAAALTPDELKLYEAAKKDVNIRTFFTAQLSALGEPSEKNADQWRAILADYMKQSTKQSMDPTAEKRILEMTDPGCGEGKRWDGANCVKSEATPREEKKPGKTGETSLADKCASLKGKDKETCEKAAAAQEKKKKEEEEKKKALAGADEKAKSGNMAGPPEHGETPTTPEEKKDPNKWNSTIAGGKMAIWAGLIGLILGGPMGLMLAACVGFGAGYFIKEMS